MGKRDGFALLQAMVVLGVALALFSLLVPIALRSSRGANASASETKLKATILRARFSLSETTQCINRLLPNAPLNLTVGGPWGTGVNEVAITDPNTGADILRGQNWGGPTYTQAAEFKVISVQLQPTYKFLNPSDNYPPPGNPTPGGPPGTGVETRYLANIVVTALRNSTGASANFLGSASIQESFPIIFEWGPGPTNPDFCSSRSNYLIQIGPAAPYKSVLECYDRDGLPVLTGSYYVCQIPYAPGGQQVMFSQGCNPPPPLSPGQGMLNYEGWTPAAIAPPAGALVQYCI